jgi:hypothetical protein
LRALQLVVRASGLDSVAWLPPAPRRKHGTKKCDAAIFRLQGT